MRVFPAYKDTPLPDSFAPLRKWLTGAFVPIETYEDQVRSRAMTFLLIALMPLAILLPFIASATYPGPEPLWQHPSFVVPVLLFLFCIPPYFLSRFGRYKLASALIAVYTIITILVMALADERTTAKLFDATFLLIPILFASIMLSRRAVLIIAAAGSIGLFALPLLVPTVTLQNVLVGPFCLILVGTILSLFDNWLRDTLGRYHTTTLKEANRALQVEIVDRKRAEQELNTYQVQLEHLVDERTAELTAINETLEREIAERTQAQDQLAVSFSLLQATLESTAEGILVFDRSGQIVIYNRKVVRMWNIPDAIIAAQDGQSALASAMLMLKEPDSYANQLRAAFDDPEGENDYLLEMTDGKILECYSRPQRQGKEVVGKVLTFRDVTERERIETELKELNHLKTEFLSTAAHELRTPLTSIRGFSELLLSRPADDVRRKRFLGLIHDQATQLGKLIDDLLDVSRLEAKRHLTLTLEPINMADLMNEALLAFAEEASSHHTRMEGWENCPLIVGDPFRLAQVARNLLSNATKYSPIGSTITIRGQVVAGSLQVSVQDTGIGLTPEQQSHLFEKFYRANMSNTAVGGTGLGLAISRLIVELHGGKIWLESEYGVGTTVHFSLPVVATPSGSNHKLRVDKAVPIPR